MRVIDAVLGIDIGTGSVKVIAVSRQGKVIQTVSEHLKMIQPQTGYNEQRPDDWVSATIQCIKKIVQDPEMANVKVHGISLSGQMHSLIILDQHNQPIRNAILWNDTRTTEQCVEIRQKLGDYVLENPVLEGFTLTKLLWIKANEPENWAQIATFLLPKDYVRYKLTGNLHMEYSDASSTLLLDPVLETWSEELATHFTVDHILPNLVASEDFVGYVTPELARKLGLKEDVAVFAGGGDNACGALGAGVIKDEQTLCSIGTSGVVLSCDSNAKTHYRHNLHFFKHVIPNQSYVMGVTLAAGDSLNWLRSNILSDVSYEQIFKEASASDIGSNGLLFAPYLSGERTPHGDSSIRGSFIGLSALHTRGDMARAVIEGITYSLYESICLLRAKGKAISEVVAIGGGAKNDFWLQLQADMFNAKVKRLKYEEGPCMGAAILAIKGLNWYNNLDAIMESFICFEQVFYPNQNSHEQYQQYFEVYKKIYTQTRELTSSLLSLSKK